MPLARLRRFWSHRDGNVAIIFALASLPLLGFAGAAVDYGLATRLRTKLQAAADASTLMLCQTASTTTNTVLNAQALVSMTSYMGSSVGLTVNPLTITASPRKILLTAGATAPMFFGGFLNRTSNGVSVQSQCASPMPKTFEIALVLDTTGSMANSGGSGSKLSAAQTAASNFIDYVKNNSAFSADTRISIVPFAASVNVGTSYASSSWVDTTGASTYHWTNVDKTLAKAAGFTSRFSIFSLLSAKYAAWAWGGCFETLPFPDNTKDGTPSSSDTLYVPLFAPDEPGNGSINRVAFKAGSTTYYSYNSYIDDTTSIATCKASPTSFQAAENSACKYVALSGASSTTSSDVGIPNGPNFMCTSKPLQRLTTSAATLKSLVSSLVASGATNIHEGFMWGWRTLSPKSVFADGGAYNATTTNKVIILMTDGANSWTDNPYNNYNQTLYFPMGYFLNADGTTPDNRLPTGYRNLTNASDARTALDQLTLLSCTNAQAAGISIYTIGFSVSSDPIDTQGTTLLANCASSPSQAYIANTSDDLIAAFSKIASSIGSLRISQ
ncbi:pilus assembly protein [Methylobacterium sp. BTF04]|uniref:TadE/TadG family type IV pilus assembly protein n=1 Tax=Methylobacterium sp. BTF04 TaxID=2708300 RepID=UPI0013D7A87C|nr:TadE/TadG family type IV pilus assembly protein [Methylobacterium sp. BTF04]NEU11223.1 pilus assembly protein [Methylobacterium sp. BTF04]